jgi:glucosamine 6-phosphate synthetase-like amidotransferase/phosphosugar isomerase protein
MCGIFGFVTKQPLSMTKVFNVLQKLEVSRYPNENQPVGGYGAGVAVLLDDGNVFLEKVGKTSDSPASQLAEVVKPQLTDAKVLVGHVRFPSGEFLATAEFKEAAQPYVGEFEPELTVVSVHNGRLGNYKELSEKLKGHVFESAKAGVIDSEIIPHFFGELVNEGKEAGEAADELLCGLKGKTVGSIALLQMDSENAFLHILHKGWSRGLTVWANEKGEVIFCSRPEPVVEEFKEALVKGEFKEKAVVKPREAAGLRLSFPVPSE